MKLKTLQIIRHHIQIADNQQLNLLILIVIENIKIDRIFGFLIKNHLL